MQKSQNDVLILLVIVSGLIILLVAFIITILFLYRKRQQTFEKSIEEIKLDHEKTLLSTQLEIQEQTFEHISREIHDNISLSLTLAKLQLHTIDWKDQEGSITKVDSSIGLLTNSIAGLRDLSKGLNADVIIQHGLLRALEDEIERIREAGLFELDFILNGNPVYFDHQKEVIIFRMVQEAFNNIIKHAGASKTALQMDFLVHRLLITITDNGKGFDITQKGKKRQAGLKNMESRARIVNGELTISSSPGKGTCLQFSIPY